MRPLHEELERLFSFLRIELLARIFTTENLSLTRIIHFNRFTIISTCNNVVFVYTSCDNCNNVIINDRGIPMRSRIFLNNVVKKDKRQKTYVNRGELSDRSLF